MSTPVYNVRHAHCNVCAEYVKTIDVTQAMPASFEPADICARCLRTALAALEAAPEDLGAEKR